MFSGSIIRQGEIGALVYATGKDTYFGKTAELVQAAQTVSHFQLAVLKIGKFLILLALAQVAVIALVSILRGDPLLNTLRFVLVLTIAAIPVAMPTVLSVTMAVGARLLATKQAIVSRLVAIEELAGVDVLCSDKTGTLTQNKLTLGDPFAAGNATAADVILDGALASRADDNDTIDLAVLAGLDQAALHGYELVHFRPFDPVHKRTEATVRPAEGSMFKVTKGAPQVILALASNADEVKPAIATAMGMGVQVNQNDKPGTDDRRRCDWCTVVASGGSPPPPPGAKHATSTRVTCNYVVATSTDTCTATVGDPATTGATPPTGSVSFASAHGLFLFGPSCALHAGSGGTSFCSVEYLSPDIYLPTSTAAYAGDSTHGPSSGKTQYLGAATDATTTETTRPTAPGKVPSEIDVSFEVPTSSSLVTACALPGRGGAVAGAAFAVLQDIGIPIEQILHNLNIDTQAVTAAGSSLSGLFGSGPNVIPQMNTLIEEALAGFSSDPAQRQLQVQSPEGKQVIDGVLRALKAEGAQCGGPAASGSSPSPSARARRHLKRIVPLAVVVRHRAHAGKLTLRLRFDPRRIARLSVRRRSVRVYVRVNLVLPSQIVPGGVPRAIGEWVTLHRAKARHRPKKH